MESNIRRQVNLSLGPDQAVLILDREEVQEVQQCLSFALRCDPDVDPEFLGQLYNKMKNMNTAIRKRLAKVARGENCE